MEEAEREEEMQELPVTSATLPARDILRHNRLSERRYGGDARRQRCLCHELLNSPCKRHVTRFRMAKRHASSAALREVTQKY